MAIDMTEKKQEAISRMKMMGIFPETIRQFEEEGFVSISEPPMGAFFWAEGEDIERIRQFEERYHALVYLVVRSYTSLGKMDAYLFVGDYVEEWEMDRAELGENRAFCYVYNHDMPDCSELGDIGIERTPAAGLRRIW